MSRQAQEADQRSSEVPPAASGEGADLAAFLRSGPSFDELEIDRSATPWPDGLDLR